MASLSHPFSSLPIPQSHTAPPDSAGHQLGFNRPSQGRVLMVVHQRHSSPGLVGELLQATGYTLDLRCPAIGQPLPASLDDHDAVVVFGGPMSANDDGTLPFIRTELDWIATVLETEKPFLGICLGAQLLARVLGGTVYSHADELMEIGYSPITQTAAGKAVWGDLQHVFQWHREGFTMPRNTVLLAKGDRFPNQAFRYGNQAYGLQFHPEITHRLIDRWTTLAAEHLQRPEAQSRDSQFQAHTTYGNGVENWLAAFLRQWLIAQQSLWELGELA